MSSKQSNVKPPDPTAPEAAPDALRIAYEIHTLAQMVYSRLAPQASPPALAPGLFH